MTAATWRNWTEIAATVLLALAAVATAWSSYQARAGTESRRRRPQP